MDNRRLLLAIVLSMGLLLLWGYLFPPPEAPAPQPAAETPVTPAAEPAAEPAPPAGERRAEAEPEPAAAEPTVEAPEPTERVEAEREEHPVVETARARVELTNRGAQIVSFRLKEHANAQGEPMDLVHARVSGPYPFALVDRDGSPLPVNDALFTVDRSDRGRTLTFRYSGPAGRVEKRFRFDDDGLFEVEVDAPGRRDWGIFLGPGIRNPSAEELKSRFADRSAVYRVGDEVSRVRVSDKKLAPQLEIPGAGLAWIGLQDNYFLSAFLPSSQTPLARAILTPYLLQPGTEGEPGRFLPLPPGGPSDEQEDLVRDVALTLGPAGDRFAASCYWDAKQYDRLASLPGGLERTINLGWFAVLARPMMIALDWLHDNVVGNYGWAIVLMTVGIKLLLLPLTHKSTVSMRKMQELNPKMQAIRQKYAGKLKDKQGRPNLEAQRKMNEEIMALYKSEGVNPAGGCLPMLLQMPIFFAFYKILYVSVELRGAPWIAWILDLSARDPYYILPIIMGVTQFAQQAMMPATGNPSQRRIMMLMPVFFTFLFAGFPSGLVLYWLTNNLLQIGQQAAYNRFLPRTAQQEKAKGVEKGKGSSAGGKKGGKVREKKKTA